MYENEMGYPGLDSDAQTYKEADAMGRYTEDLPLDSYGFPFVLKDNGKVDKTYSVCYAQVPMGFEYSKEWLKALEFTDVEIQAFDFLLNTIGHLTEKRLRARRNITSGAPFYSDRDIALLMYMYKACVKGMDSTKLSDIDFMMSHKNRLFNLRNADNTAVKKGNIAQLSRDAFQSIGRRYDKYPRRVEIAGIDDPVFSYYNSDNFVKYDRLYTLAEGTNVGKEFVTIITDKTPRIAWKGRREVENVCKLAQMGMGDSGVLSDEDRSAAEGEALYELKIHRDYVRFKPTYYVYVTTKKEAGVKVDGMDYMADQFLIIGESGVTLTVAIGVHQLGKHERNKIPMSETVLGIAYYPGEAVKKLVEVAKEVYEHGAVRGVSVVPVQGNCSLRELEEYSKVMTAEERDVMEMESGILKSTVKVLKE